MTIASKKAIKKKRVRRDRTNEILETATRLFSENGFRGTTIAQVAEAVELTEAGVLHYFPSKVKLLEGVLNYREKEDQKKYSAMTSLENPEFSELIRILQQLVADNQQKPALIRLFTVLVAESIRTDHPSHDHFVNRYNSGRQLYGQVFKQLQEEGQIRADLKPDQLGSLFMAVMDGLQTQWLLDPNKVDMAETFELFSKMMSAYLEK